MRFVFFFSFCFSLANICIAQNNVTNNIAPHRTIIKGLEILDINRNPIEENFCDSNLRQCIILVTVANEMQFFNEQTFLTYVIHKKNKAQNIIEKKIGPLSIFKKTFTLEDTLNLKNIGTGNYLMQAIVAENNVVQDSATIFMQRWNDNVVDTLKKQKGNRADVIDDVLQNNSVINIKNTFVAKYGSTTIINYLKACMPAANAIEYGVINQLLQENIDSINRQFFYNFWQNRNTKNPQLEWEAYAKKLNYVAENYGGAGVAGYSTDRGRIYLKYGEPARSESVSNEQGTVPYEVWQYDAIQNGKEITFLFSQIGMLGSQMSLLHSTMPGEIFNPYWANTIIKDLDKTDYRVYNYLDAPNALNKKK